jgi:hypothetical protein
MVKLHDYHTAFKTLKMVGRSEDFLNMATAIKENNDILRQCIAEMHRRGR